MPVVRWVAKDKGADGMKGGLGRRASPDKGMKYLCGEMAIAPIIENAAYWG